MLGIFLILFSYVIGWPLIGVLGWLAFYVTQPVIVIAGGPVAYAVSNLVFFVGMYLAGKPYATALMNWLVQFRFETILGPELVRPDRSSEGSG